MDLILRGWRNVNQALTQRESPRLVARVRWRQPPRGGPRIFLGVCTSVDHISGLDCTSYVCNGTTECSFRPEASQLHRDHHLYLRA